MESVYTIFFRKLLENKDRLSRFINELYAGKEYSSCDLNEIFGVLKSEGLISGIYAEDRFQDCMITFKGKHYFDDQDNTYTDSIDDKPTANKKPMLFISHASENKAEAKALVDLLKSIGLGTKDQIFCSSLPGYDVPMYKDMFAYLKSCFTDADAHVIFLLSEAYYDSAYCLNEMGAAWVMQSKYTAILLPGFHKEQMGGFLKDKEPAIQLGSDYNEARNKLDQFRDLLIKDFYLKALNEDEWDRACNSFMEAVITVSRPFRRLVKRSFQSYEISDQATICLQKCASEDDDILISYDITYGKEIQIGKETVAKEIDRRNYARWEAAIEECHKAGFLKQNRNGYSVTDSGFQYIDNIQKSQ